MSNIRNDAYDFVQRFNCVLLSFIKKVLEHEPYELNEITPPAVGCRVEIVGGEYEGEQGDVWLGVENEKSFKVRLDGSDEMVIIPIDDMVRIDDDSLPMWGWMWSFGNSMDNEWLEEHLQEMANCGFRIYEQEDFGYLFGIDGAGYDFYDEHWIPLYKVRFGVEG